MKQFKPCLGKMACRDNGEICLSCGRSLAEIAELRDAMSQLVDLAVQQGYENVDEYCAYIATKVQKSIQYRREQESES